jgi:hypothetical protein
VNLRRAAFVPLRIVETWILSLRNEMSAPGGLSHSSRKASLLSIWTRARANYRCSDREKVITTEPEIEIRNPATLAQALTEPNTGQKYGKKNVALLNRRTQYLPFACRRKSGSSSNSIAFMKQLA